MCRHCSVRGRATNAQHEGTCAATRSSCRSWLTQRHVRIFSNFFSCSTCAVWSGAVRCGAVRLHSGTGRGEAVWCGVWCVVWCGVVMWSPRPFDSVVWYGAVWYGAVWYGAVCVVWCGVVWCGVVWCGVLRCGVVWCSVVWCSVVWCGVVWCGVVWRSEVRCGAVPWGAVPCQSGYQQ